ncbi:zinc finger protein 208-like [Eriocheir sinensis]|uniref:zinc finger protein 208-like n=1 Tax=Eriocheir sinensis TaxID=95602 RepID=UPI0021C6BFE9|nr:zinc finger protein 208-like [Eriocheir sinensis]
MMEGRKCVVCVGVPDDKDPCILLLHGITEHTATPLREVVGPALQPHLTSTDIICARCLKLFNEKDRLQKLTTDMGSHIQTKIQKVGTAGDAAAAVGAINIVVGSAPERQGIKDQLERQYKGMKVAAEGAAAMTSETQPSEAQKGRSKVDTNKGSSVLKRRRGRPPNASNSSALKPQQPRQHQQPPPLMVNQREKRKRSAKFSTFLEVLKGEKEFYIEDEDVEEPKGKRRSVGKQRTALPGVDIVEVEAGREEEGPDGTCIIQVTDMGLPAPREGLALDDVVQEILGLTGDATGPLISMEGLSCSRGTQEEEEENLIIAISKMSAAVEAESSTEASKPESDPSIRLEPQQEEQEERGKQEQQQQEDGGGGPGGGPQAKMEPGGGGASSFIEVTAVKEDLAAGVEVVLSHGGGDTFHATISNPATPPSPSPVPTLAPTPSPTATPAPTPLSASIRSEVCGDAAGASSATATAAVKKYRCKMCASTFLGREEARQHAQECHKATQPPAGRCKQDSFPCSECERCFPTERGRDRHRLHMHHRHHPVQCPDCPATFNSFRPLERHLRHDHDHNPTLYCEACDMEFVLGTSLEHHREIMHPAPPGRVKTTRAPPRQRIKKPDKQRHVFCCPLCREEVAGVKAFRLHHQKMHNGCEYTCNYCSFKTLCFSSLNRHMVRVHKAFDMKLYTCSSCSACYSLARDLEEHYRCMHGAEPTLLCQHCGDKFACAEMLRFHRNTHRAFQCKLCHLGFMKEEALEDHVRTIHSCDPVGSTESSGTKGQAEAKGASAKAKGDERGRKGSESTALEPKVLVITSDGLVQVKEEKKEVGGEPSGDVTLHLQQTVEGGLEEMDVLNPLKGQRVKDLPKKMNCPVCNKVLTTKFLRTHMLSHKGSLPHKCQFCDKAYAQGTLLRKHMKNRHHEEFQKLGNKNPKKHKVACDFCQEIFDSIYLLEEHLWMHMEEKTFECSDCKIKFGMESNLREHYKSHYFKEAKPCPVCQREFKSIGYYNDHVEKCQKRWKCEQCGLECDTQEYYRKHQRAEHGGENVVRYQCSLCDKSFVDRHRYDDHMITHSSEKAFTCHICLKQFKRQRPLNDHLMRTHSSSLLVCPYCSKTFQKHTELKAHKLKHRREYPCSSCSRSYSSNEALVNHHLVHHAEATLLCHVCSEPFARQLHLKNHLVTHSSSTPNICQVDGCHKMFRSESLLRNHAARRHQELHYDCSLCDRKFSLESDQVRHAATHLGGSSVACEECGRSFRSEAQLERHLLTHTQEKPYECEVCQQSANSRQQILRHIQAEHGLTEGTCHVIVNRWQCSTCSKMFVAQSSILRHLEEHTGQGVEAIGQAIKTRLVPSPTLELSLPSSSVDPATATDSFLEQVSSLSWQDLTRLLRFHIMSDGEADKGEQAAVSTSVWQCPGCLHATHSEDDMRDHLEGSTECQEAVILQLAGGLAGTDDMEDESGAEEPLVDGHSNETVVQLASADGGLQYIIMREEGDTSPPGLGEGCKEGQGGQEAEEGMQVLVSVDDSLQQLLHQQPTNPNIQIVVEDAAPLKQFLVENTNADVNTDAVPINSSPTNASHDALPAETPLLNGSEVLLQTVDGKLFLQQTVGGVTQYQLVEGVPTTPIEDGAPGLLPTDHAPTLEEGFIMPS